MLPWLITIQTSLWFCLACFRGFFESIIWHCNTAANNILKKDYHPHILAERGLLFFSFLLPVLFFSLKLSNFLVPIAFSGTLFFCYPFFHNGSKYLSRNYLNPKVYKLGWKADPSTTSIAKMNLSWRQRKISFVIGMLFFVFTIYLSW